VGRRQRLIAGAALVGAALILAGCGPGALPTSGPNRVGLRVVLDTETAPAGPAIKGFLVVTNPYAPIDLTQVEKAKQSVRCQPGFQIYLRNANVDNRVGFDMDCATVPFVLAHGTTRIPVRVFTTFTGCSPNALGVVPLVPCLASGALPPLPAGSYRTAIQWSEPVPLAPPVPVRVVLRAPS
jgi:hypothetical protein